MSKMPPRAPARVAAAPAAAPPGGGVLELLRTSSVPRLVQKELERMINSGDLAAGSKLSEEAIAERLGVSRGPVREAFRGLEEAGLVRLEKNRGVFVRQIGIEEADEIYEVRALLDQYAGRKLARMRSAEAVRELRARVEVLERAAARRDLDAYVAANLAFHERLVELAGNAKLLATYRRLVAELNLYRRTALGLQDTMAVSSREHREIVDRIAAGQGAAAGKALFEHVMRGRERMHRAVSARKPESAAARRR